MRPGAPPARADRPRRAARPVAADLRQHWTSSFAAERTGSTSSRRLNSPATPGLMRGPPPGGVHNERSITVTRSLVRRIWHGCAADFASLTWCGAPRKAWSLTLFGWIWRDARVLSRRRSFDQLNGRCARSIERVQATVVLLLDESLDLLLAPTLLALAPLANVVIPALSPTCGAVRRHLPMTLLSRWRDSIREDCVMFSVLSFARGRELGLRRLTLAKVDLPGTRYITSTDVTRAGTGSVERPLLACERGRDRKAPQTESAVVDCGLDLKCIAAGGRTATLPVDARSGSFAGSKRHSSGPAANRV